MGRARAARTRARAAAASTAVALAIHRVTAPAEPYESYGTSNTTGQRYEAYTSGPTSRSLAKRKSMSIPEFQEAMKGYHDLIDHGRREIYQLEG